MARQWERVDEDTAVGPRFGQDPPPSFSAPTLAYTYRQWKRDFRLWQAISSLQKNRQGGWLLRQLKGDSRTAAEVFMDDALVQDDGIDLIVEELDRCWEVTQDQSVEDRTGPLRDTKGRQNGDDLHVLCGKEEASLSTTGECTGDVTTSSDQGSRDSTRRETCRKQLRQGGDVDRW